MENKVRVIRKLEDLDGLENRMGLSLQKQTDIRHGDYEEILCLMHNGLASLTFELSSSDTKYFSLLKAMGFDFEYKPIRTKEEVLEEIQSLGRSFECENYNFFIELDRSEGKYQIETYGMSRVVGAKYFTEEQAKKYADELNEIIKSQ